MSSLQDILNFVELTEKFRKIERDIKFSKEQRFENDVEHSFQLAMVAWYIISSNKLKYDIDKIIKYALVHDLVEVYAGDTSIFLSSKDHFDSKGKREEEAAQQLRKEFSDFPELHELIHAYEEKKDNESKFIYALDKLLPVFVIYFDNGYYWKEGGITIEMMLEKKKDKLALVPELNKYFEEMMELLRKSEKDYFNK
jgi:putative hydrolases of HD superfamily